jgi:hypothetical protein
VLLILGCFGSTDAIWSCTPGNTRVGEGGTGAGGTRTCVCSAPHGLCNMEVSQIVWTNRVSLAQGSLCLADPDGRGTEVFYS